MVVGVSQGPTSKCTLGARDAELAVCFSRPLLLFPDFCKNPEKRFLQNKLPKIEQIFNS